MVRITKAFITAMFSAIIGTLVALKLDPSHTWLAGLVGAVLSFFVGYTSWEFKKVIEAIKDVLYVMNGMKIDFGRLLEKLIPFFKWYSKRIIITISIEISIFSYIYILHATGSFLSRCMTVWIDGNNVMVFLSMLSLIIGMLILFSAVVLMIFSILLFIFALFTPERIIRNDELVDLLRKMSPVNLILLFLLSILEVAPVFYKKIMELYGSLKKSIKGIPMFLFLMYKEIHSELRLTIAVDGSLGCLAGYFILDDVLVGGFVGGTLVVINYYIIALRVLKLNPSKIK